jgi:hypothetical protein
MGKDNPICDQQSIEASSVLLQTRSSILCFPCFHPEFICGCLTLILSSFIASSSLCFISVNISFWIFLLSYVYSSFLFHFSMYSYWSLNFCLCYDTSSDSSSFNSCIFSYFPSFWTFICLSSSNSEMFSSLICFNSCLC